MNFYFTKNKFDESIGIIHFGIGLIGTTIKNRLFSSGMFNDIVLSSHPFDWNKPQNTDKYLTQFFLEKKYLFQRTKKIYIVWSAGKAGFYSTDEEVDAQLWHFEKTLNCLVEKISQLNLPFAFFLMSSAGGLFEGQTLIDNSTRPNVKRAYGRLKLEEENIILKHPYAFEKNIFRISSVYSISVFDKRKGLMLVLMQNGLKHKVTSIIGQESTIRDYVLDEDIADYLIHLIYENSNPGAINFLVSSKPSSIFEIRKQIEKILQKRIYINYSLKKSNAANMSYENAVVAKGFKPTNFRTNLKMLYLNLRK